MIPKALVSARPSPKALARRFALRTGFTFDPPVSGTYTDNNASPVRAIPEYAPSGGVLIAYPGSVPPPTQHVQLPTTKVRDFGIPDELIIRMQQLDTAHPVHIFILCDDAGQLPVVQRRLDASAAALKLPFDPDLIHFVPWDTDTYWTRDYGPWWIRNEHTGRFGIAKHIYTSLGGGSVGLVEGAEHVTTREGLGIFRPNDDSAAVKFSDYLNTPIRAWDSASWDPDGDNNTLSQVPPHDWFCTGLLEVGGNYMVTSDGVIASSYLVATQNELPVCEQPADQGQPGTDEIERRMRYILDQFNRFMGINTYHVLSDPTGTYIGHIDCWGKFLADRKVLIADSQHVKVHNALDTIARTFQEEWGFDVTRVLCEDIYLPQVAPPDNATTAAYTNSLILNDHVYVPIVGPPHEEDDKKALDSYRTALPGYNIVGIPPKADTPWLGTDALHCRTHEVPQVVVDNWLKCQVPH